MAATEIGKELAAVSAIRWTTARVILHERVSEEFREGRSR
jgi:hypothetical protein